MGGGVRNVAAISLQIGYPTLASAPHSIVNGMKKCLALAAVTDITFKEAEKLKEYLADHHAALRRRQLEQRRGRHAIWRAERCRTHSRGSRLRDRMKHTSSDELFA